MDYIRKRTALLLLLFALTTCLTGADSFAGTNVWTGAGPAGGAFWAFEFDPSDPNIIYAGGYNSGVYKSTDAGATWTATGLPSMQVTQLLADPAQGGTLYAANAWGGGIYKSTDKGATWTNIGTGLGSKEVRGFVYDPSQPATLYAAIYNAGVYKSTNGGATWTLYKDGMTDFSYYTFTSLAIDRRNPATLYLMANGNPGLYKSTNGGLTWSSTGGNTYLNAYSILVDPSNSNNIYVAGWGNSCFYKSTNAGGSWTLSTTGIPARSDGTFANWLAIDPSNPSILYMATRNNNLFKSTNRGDSWSSAGNGLFNNDVQIIAMHPSNPQVLYAGTWGSGVFKTANGAGTWAQQSLNGIQIKSLSVNPSDAKVVYAATMGGGVNKSTDGGQTWTYSGLSSVQINGLAIDPKVPSTIWALASGYNGTAGVMKSTDSGATWKETFSGFNDKSFYAVAADPAVSGVVYVGTFSDGGGIYKTSNGGSSWSLAGTGIPKSVTIQEIRIDPLNNQNLSAVAGNIPYRSTNGGSSWAEISSGLPSKKSRTISFDGKNAGTMFLGTLGSGLFKSTNGGTSWNSLALPSGFTSANVYSIAVDPSNAQNLFAATNSGVLHSLDGGASWVPMNSGLVDKNLFTIATGPKDATNLFVGTSTRGVYSYTGSAAAMTLFYPRLVTSDGVNGSPDTSEYTGIAAANLGATDASLTFTAYDLQGRLISGAGVTNPATLPLPKGAQLPIVDTQVWGSGLPAARPVGWFTMDSTSPKVVGFFLVYNSTLSILDGADVSAAKTDSFIFPEVEPSGFTQIHVANPNTAAATVTFDLKNSDGSTKRTAARTLPPFGSVSERLGDMFSGEALDGTEYVSVRGNGGLVPFEYLGRIPYRVQGLNGQGALAGATTLYSPQYAVGGSTWATTISVVNLESVPGTVTFRLIGDNGTPIGISRSLPIAAAGKIRITDQDFFVKAGSILAQGYVEIKSSGPKLAGSVVFGDQAGTAFSAALPLVGALQGDVVFSQVASNSTWYTGLALLNPGSTGASATIQVYDRAGQLLRSKVETIEASGRKSMLLTQYFPDLNGVEIGSGYIRAVSDQPLATFALFGAANVLSAVPPQIVP